MAKRAKAEKLQQGTFFEFPGEPEPEPEPEPREEIVPFFFGDIEVRAYPRDSRGDDIWFIAADVCRALKIENTAQAVSRLDDDEKGIILNDTLGGAQEMVIVSEPGLYELVIGCRKRNPEARRFRRWITHDVIPALRKRGFYAIPAMPSSQVDKIRRRLRCDTKTAEVRFEGVKINKHSHGRLKQDGAGPGDYAAWHNAAYDAQFHKTCAELRKDLGQPKSRSPQDRMTRVVLAPSNHAKVLADRIIEDARESGRPIAVNAQPAILHQILEQFSVSDLKRLGPGYHYGVRDDDVRGKVIDAMRKIEAAPDKPGRQVQA